MPKEGLSPNAFQLVKERISKLPPLDEKIDFNLVSITNLLSENNQKILDKLGDHGSFYLKCLDNVWRWKTHLFKEAVNNVNESDYSHILEMLEISNEIKDKEIFSPEILNFDDLQILIIVHDGGEIFTGDISYVCEKNDSNNLLKEIEPKIFRICLNSFLQNHEFSEIKQNILNLYNHYELKKKSSSELIFPLVKYIDIIQGDSYALKNIYDKRKLLDKYIEQANVLTEKQGIPRQIGQMKIILESLNNPNERKKFYDFAVSKIQMFNTPEYGYQDIFSHFKDQINSLKSLL